MKAILQPHSSLKILTGPWHSESADMNLPLIQIGSRQNSEVSKDVHY